MYESQHQNIVYMNGANADPFVITIRPLSNKRTMIIGAKINFLLSFISPKSSLISSIIVASSTVVYNVGDPGDFLQAHSNKWRFVFVAALTGLLRRSLKPSRLVKLPNKTKRKV